MCFFVQTNHTRKELLFLMFKEINLRNHSSLHKLFYSLDDKNSNNKKDEVRMIFPSTNKYMQSYEEPYFDLISRFQDIII